MRINVTGDCESASALRAMLKKAGYVLGKIGMPGTVYTVILEESAAAARPIVDGVDSELERRIVNAICELSPSGGVVLQRTLGVQSEYEIRVVVPPVDEERSAVELGTLRGLMQVVPHGKKPEGVRVGPIAKAVVQSLLLILGLR